MATEISGGIAGRVLEGAVFTDGVAQSVIREAGGVRVRLTCMPGKIPGTGCSVTKVSFPEPVTVAAGEWIAVEMDWLGEAERQDVSQPMLMSGDAVITSAHAGPSFARPGHAQGAVSGTVLPAGPASPGRRGGAAAGNSGISRELPRGS